MPISPSQGTTGGGTTVTITGTNLGSATAVRFGSKTATITGNTETSVTVVSPSGAGPVPVTVTTPGGIAGPLTFYYIGPPFKASLSPAVGVVAGGDTVTITGIGLSTAQSVAFGAESVEPTVVNDGELTVTVPAGAAAGVVGVTVTTAGGSTNGLSYTYVDAPSVGTPFPTSGSVGGGTAVTIPGTGLTTTTSVTFGGVPAPFAVLSDAQVVAVSPANPAGTVDIVVTTAGGSDTAAGAFTYTAL